MTDRTVAVSKKYWMPWHSITVPLLNENWLKPLTKKVVDDRAKKTHALTIACGVMSLSFLFHVTWYALVPGLICSLYAYTMLFGAIFKSNVPHFREDNWIAHQPTQKAMLYSYVKPHELQWLEDYEKPEVLEILKSLSVEQGFIIKGQVLAARLQAKKNSIDRTKKEWCL